MRLRLSVSRGGSLRAATRLPAFDTSPVRGRPRADFLDRPSLASRLGRDPAVTVDRRPRRETPPAAPKTGARPGFGRPHVSAPDPWTATLTVVRDPLSSRVTGRGTPLRMGARPMLATLDTMIPARKAGWTALACLVERAQAGDREAFGELVEQFQRTVYAVCLGRLGNPSEALELTQEVFLHVMRRLDQLREPERFAGWLRQVTVRMAINRATRRLAPSSVETVDARRGVRAAVEDPACRIDQPASAPGATLGGDWLG